MTDYAPTIGLEIHAQLKTKTKMFCSSKNDPDEKNPNVNVCPICMGHPGTLPVINKEAVTHVLRIGTAVDGAIADFTEFDRKNYFYPDIPKGYQISQYKYPLVKGGMLSGITLTRIHLEEDTARSTHEGGVSLVDFNRAGIPLMELVTEPEIASAKQAGDFARELQLLLRTLKIAEANMEKGEMRVEANISVSKDGALGTKVEVKNLNSFRAVERAIDFELGRQIEVLEGGEKVIQETRGWDEGRQATFSQRTKETSEDYRYFPDPDLPKLMTSVEKEFVGTRIKDELPELPWEKRERYQREYGIKTEDIEVLVQDHILGALFEESVSNLSHENKKEGARLVSSYITSDIQGLRGQEDGEGNITAGSLAELIEMLMANEVSSRAAKDILSILYKEGGAARDIAEQENLMQISSENALSAITEAIVDENPEAVEEYKKGKDNALMYLVGQGMKKTSGAANPALLKELLQKRLQQ